MRKVAIMEYNETEEGKLDILTITATILKIARRTLVLALILAAVCAAALGIRSYRQYSPYYIAHASFTVKVANPLYSSVDGYNSKTAEQMAATFPSLLTSGVLQERIQEHLGIAYMPTVTVDADPSTSIITIQVRDSDPQRAYDVLNAVIEYYPEVAEFVVGSTVLVLLDESGVPAEPANQFRIAASLKKGAAAGLILWLAVVAAMAFARSTVHNEEELNALLNVPCLAQIPSVRTRYGESSLLIAGEHTHARFQETIRLLHMRVEKALEARGKKVLLISSATPGEGKTTISTNLALSLAQKGKRVLLIDFDMRNPSVGRMLNIKINGSLSEWFRGKATLRDLITRTKHQNLYVIAGGSCSGADASKMLADKLVGELIRSAAEQFDYVLLDTPPCSMLADAAEIAGLADCGLMVIRQDYASRDQILEGVQFLDDSGLPMIGCAMNGVRSSFGSGYGRGYGYGAKQ